MSNGEHEIRTPKGLRIGNRSVVDGKNMLQIKRGGCEDYISAESLVECIHGLPVKSIEFFHSREPTERSLKQSASSTLKAQRRNLRRHLVSRPAPSDVLSGLQYNICLFRAIP